MNADERLKNTDDPEYDEALFEQVLEMKSKNHDHTDLLEFVEVINDPDVSAQDLFDQGYLNKENYLTWMASNVVLGNRDTMSQNFYLYHPIGTKTWYFLPWDYDGALGFWHQKSQQAKPRPRWTRGFGNWWNVRLHRKILQDPNIVEQLDMRVHVFKRDLTPLVDIDAMLLEYKDIVMKHVFSLPDRHFLPIV